ncbi:MAG: kelch repeat-containing protein [Kofleriaceae bacterium]
MLAGLHRPAAATASSTRWRSATTATPSSATAAPRLPVRRDLRHRPARLHIGEQCDDANLRSGDLCDAGCGAEALTWRREVPADDLVRAPLDRADAVAVYDPARARLVLFGGQVSAGGGTYLNDTWEWDGATWFEALPPTLPPARASAAAFYDQARHRIVMFGGRGNGGALADTWTWDGAAWRQPASAASPTPRSGAAATYDGVRGEGLLFGGSGAATVDDTWRWTAAGWILATPATRPPPRQLHAMAFDPAAGEVVLFGGQSAGLGDLADTWRWNGSDWAPTSPANRPSARQRHGMAYSTADGGIVLDGGAVGSVTSTELWRWTGQDWVALPFTAPWPGQQLGHPLASDPRGRRIFLFGAQTAPVRRSAVWIWNGASWTSAAATAPPARTRAAVAYDPIRDRLLQFGGVSYGTAPPTGPRVDDTFWEAAGTAWQEILAPGPSPRAEAALAVDVHRAQAILFGGFTGLDSGEFTGGITANPSSETWAWDGTSWTRRTPATRPPARGGHGMAYDVARGVVVMFGGRAGTAALGDTWEWDGTTWLARPGASPPARFEHGMTFDARSGRVLVFGGTLGFAATAFAEPFRIIAHDLWAYDGVAWVELTPMTSPPSRHGAGFTYDSQLDRVVLFGGQQSQSGTALRDTWLWDGVAWSELVTGTPPEARWGASVAATPGLGVHVISGASGESLSSRDLLLDRWVLAPAGAQPREACASGVDYDGDGLIGCADDECWSTCTPACPILAFEAGSCDATLDGTPYCGDGTCQDVESCRACPTDCGACPAVCGDGWCDAPESAATCPGDCPP